MLETLLSRTTSKTKISTPINVQSHIPPPAHGPSIHPLRFITRSSSFAWSRPGMDQSSGPFQPAHPAGLTSPRQVAFRGHILFERDSFGRSAGALPLSMPFIGPSGRDGPYVPLAVHGLHPGHHLFLHAIIFMLWSPMPAILPGIISLCGGGVAACWANADVVLIADASAIARRLLTLKFISVLSSVGYNPLPARIPTNREACRGPLP